jgi:hypothetical protein
MLEFGRGQIYATPGGKIDGAEIKPNFLPFRPINRAHAQRLRSIIKEARIAEMSH